MRHNRYSYAVTLNKVNTTTARIRFTINYQKERITFSIGHKVEYTKWDDTTQRAMPNTTHTEKQTPAYIINKEIQRYQDVTDNLFANYSARDITPTPTQVRTDLSASLGRGVTPQHQATLEQLIDAYITEKSSLNQWTMGTLKRHCVMRKKLLAYTPKAMTSELGLKWLQGYLMKLVYTDKLSNNTATDQMRRVQYILQWGADNGFNIPNDFRTFKLNIPTTKKDIIFLSWNELITLYNFNYHLEYQRNVRDCFCLQCFTSLRYSDLKALRKANITDEHIIITTQKTNDLLYIDINDYSREILARHKDYSTTLPLPVYTNQVYNRYIKEVCALAGINESIPVTDIIAGERITKVVPKYSLITSHTARRTFICNALTLGIPPAIIMQWTGHSDYNSMRPYIGLMDSAKKEAMKLMGKHHSTTSAPPPRN